MDRRCQSGMFGERSRVPLQGNIGYSIGIAVPGPLDPFTETKA